MIVRRRVVQAGLALAAGARSPAAWAARRALAPLAREAPVTDELWGQTIVDPYRWMEQRPASAEFLAYLKAQGAHARQALDALPRRREIAARLEAYSAAATVVAMQQITAHWTVYYRRDPGQQSLRAYALPAAGGEPLLLVDPEALSKPGAPRTLKGVLMSPDGRHLAYVLDTGGAEIRELRILTLATREDVLVSALNAMPGSWLPDSSGLYYTRTRDDAVVGAQDYGLGQASWLHRLGTPASADACLFRTSEGPRLGQGERELPQLLAAPGSDHLLAVMYSNGEWPAYALVAPGAALEPGRTPWQAVFGADDGVQDVALQGDTIYVLAKGRAARGEVWSVDARKPAAANRVVLIPQGEHAIDSLALASDGLYVHEFRGQVGALKRYAFATGRVEDVPLPREGAVWDVKASPTREGAWFGMDSLTWPAVTLHADAQLRVTDTGLTPPAPFDTAPFTTTRLEVQARDGAMVPIEIMHRRDTPRDGRRPLLIQAYGSYGLPLDPGFVPSLLAFLELGGVMVMAHVRGGGEKGEDWHRAGMKATKPNTWRDVIDVAEALVRGRWTSPRHLALWGISAGGIMVGRAITERPDLFRVAIGVVGIFNPLRFELTANGPGNDLEFGTVKKRDEFGWLREMDSYHHVRPGVRYPATLLITGANDARVEPWQVAKLAARLQKDSASGRPVLLRVDYESGHYASTRAANVLKYTDIFAFLLAQVG